jgi:outer membrane protein
MNTKISELNLQTTKNQLRNDVTNAYTNLKIAQSRYEANVQNTNAQKLNFEFSQKRFNAGSMNSVDLLAAKNQWSQAQMQLLNSKYELLFRTLIIDFYKGKELTL